MNMPLLWFRKVLSKDRIEGEGPLILPVEAQMTDVNYFFPPTTIKIPGFQLSTKSAH